MGFKVWGEISAGLLGDICLAEHSSENTTVYFFCLNKYGYIYQTTNMPVHIGLSSSASPE